MVEKGPLVGILMGSQSDWPTMRHAADTLEKLGIAAESKVISAHRNADRLDEYLGTAVERGIKVIIAGAGMAAALPGSAAAVTPLPVLGVPMEGQMMGGLDAMLAMTQMPPGIPVGTLGLGKAGAINAAMLAAAIVAISDDTAAKSLDDFRAAQTAGVQEEPIDE